MKQLIIILLLSSATVAQPLQGIIYNFEIGDVLETKYTAYGSVAAYTEYRLDTIISKQIAGDTITYTMNRYKLGISQSGSNYNQSIESLVTVVNQPANFEPLFSCLPTTDTSYIGQCGQNSWNRETFFDTCDISPPNWSSTLIQGLGGPYYWLYNSKETITTKTLDLIYSNTTGTGECGKYYWSTAGINELIHEKKQVLKIVDYLGREIEDKPNTTLIFVYSDGTTEKVYRME